MQRKEIQKKAETKISGKTNSSKGKSIFKSDLEFVAVSAPIRWIALAGDLLVFYILLNIVFPMYGITDMPLRVNNLISVQFPYLFEYFTSINDIFVEVIKISGLEKNEYILKINSMKILPHYTLFYIINLLLVFVLGNSVGMVLVGVFSNGNFLQQRIKGFFRTVLAYFTTPIFIVTDLLCLIGKPTLKEVLTQGYLQKKNRVWVVIGSLIILISLLITPMAEGLLKLNTSKSTPEQTRVFKPNSELSENLFINGASQVLDSAFKIQLPIGVVALPRIQSPYSEKSSIRIDFIDTIGKTKVTLSSLDNSELRDEIVNVFQKNPLHFLFYPKLAKPTKEKLSRIHQQEIPDFKNVLSKSLLLSKENIIPTLLEHGPFFAPLFSLKDALVQGEMKQVKSFRFQKINEIESLVLSSGLGSKVSEAYIRLNDLTKDSFIITYKNGSKHSDSIISEIFKGQNSALEQKNDIVSLLQSVKASNKDLPRTLVTIISSYDNFLKDPNTVITGEEIGLSLQSVVQKTENELKKVSDGPLKKEIEISLAKMNKYLASLKK